MKKKFISILLVFLVFSLPTYIYAGSDDLKGKKICIDAGHGGKDPGATGKIAIYGGTTKIDEKELTLSLAETLSYELEERGAQVYMTRNNDTYVHIDDRWRYATKNDVDAFISIHFDSMTAPFGLLSFYGATRPQDKSFSKAIHNGIMDVTFVNDRGVLDDTHSNVKSLGVLRYGGSYPRTLIEVNNMNYSGTYMYELLDKFTRYARGICNGLSNYFN